MSQKSLLIVGLGGTGSPGSSSERLLRQALRACEEVGAETLCFDGAALDMPMYGYGVERTPQARALIDALRRADGVIIASPGYHGTVSGLIKNALDYVEDLANDEAAYFEGRAVGLIAVAAGWQATGTTLATLRAIVHALRGWPTPMGATVKVYDGLFSPDGECLEDRARMQLELVGRQTWRGASALALGEQAG